MKPATHRYSLQRTRLVRGALVLGLLSLLSACAPSTRVILLPQVDGQPSAVDVKTSKGSQAISQPYQVAVVGRGGTLSLDTTTPDQVRKTYPALLALQPPPAERFVLEFEPGSSQLTPSSLAQLGTVITRAQARAGGDIIVTGHTDRQGSMEANDRLSLERARTVRSLLIAQGFRPERIEAIGRGEREPLVPTDDEVVEPRNRRAEVLVR
jgi:OmpA-OmpF porin, OOP family